METLILAILLMHLGAHIHHTYWVLTYALWTGIIIAFWCKFQDGDY
jgi:hypothetical protein